MNHTITIDHEIDGAGSVTSSSGVRFYAATHEGIVIATLKGYACPTVAEACKGAIVDCVAVREKTPNVVLQVLRTKGYFAAMTPACIGERCWTATCVR
jgi:hypothetical protein